MTVLDDLAFRIGSAIALVSGVVGSSIGGSLFGGLLTGYFQASLAPKWAYTPELSHLSKAYPELSVLLLLGVFFANAHTKPVKDFMQRTSGRLAPELRYTFFDLPERCILLMHHRRHHHPGLTVQEFHDLFYILPPESPYKIITGRGWGGKSDLVSKGLKIFEERLYNAIDVRQCSKVDGNADPACLYKVYESFKRPGPMIVVVFPDKFGSQYYGDRSMFYRTGAFAAAIAAGVPLVDTISMYPTFAHQYHTARTTRIVHPNHTWPAPNVSLDPDSYVEYTKLYAKQIEDLRGHMQEQFFNDVAFEESKIGSCDADASEISDASGPLCTRCVYRNGPDSVVCEK